VSQTIRAKPVVEGLTPCVAAVARVRHTKLLADAHVEVRLSSSASRDKCIVEGAQVSGDKLIVLCPNEEHRPRKLAT
jgi:hypothetical protein